MAPSRQGFLGPMALERVSTPVATPSNLVAAVDLCALLDQAFRSEGHTAYGAAELLQMSPQSYSKAIGAQYVDNPVMKRLGLPGNRRVLRRFVVMVGEVVGIAAVDSEQNRTLREFFRVLKAVGE